ncbi:MAG: PAS domain S-box protein [Bacteroidota bacterium]
MKKNPGNQLSSETLRQEAEALLKNKADAKILELIEEIAFQNQEKTKRADELIIANKELAFQNQEKIKRAAELFVAKEKIAIQEKLIQSEQLYQALVAWSPYATLVHRDMKIVYVNPAAVKLFGATSEHDLLGTLVMRWHHPDYHEIVKERKKKAAEEGIAAPMIESKYFKIDGTLMDLEVQDKPIIYEGLPAILATFIDVTEKRLVEGKLEERLKELQTFYFINQLAERQDLSLTAFYQELVTVQGVDS